MPSPSPQTALDAWLECVWARGEGLPLPPPLHLERRADGRVIERMVLPPGLREKVVSMQEAPEENAAGAGGGDTRSGAACLDYRVLNPGWLTYPVHAHRGTVRFRRDAEADALEMRWIVAVRPYRGCGPLVKAFTSLIIGALTDAYCTKHCEKYGGAVNERLAGGEGSASSGGLGAGLGARWSVFNARRDGGARAELVAVSVVRGRPVECI